MPFDPATQIPGFYPTHVFKYVKWYMSAYPTGKSMWKSCIINPCFLIYGRETTFSLFYYEKYIFKNQVSKRAVVPVTENLETSLASRIISNLCANHVSFHPSAFDREPLENRWLTIFECIIDGNTKCISNIAIFIILYHCYYI